MAQNHTRDRLLDAAEALIAQKGYANTSLREITTKAEANLAAVNYHFGSKEGLLSAVLDRRLRPLNDERKALMESEMSKARKEGRPPDAELLLRAFIEPGIRFFHSDSASKNCMRLFGRIHVDPDGVIRQEFAKLMLPLFITLFEELQNAMPEMPAEKLAPRLYFSLGAMSHGISMLVDDDLLDQGKGLNLSSIFDPDNVVEELMQFILRGMNVK